ncbi:MAG: hypothetical protein MHPSP_002175 [Paramarteilia canceri]
MEKRKMLYFLHQNVAGHITKLSRRFLTIEFDAKNRNKLSPFLEKLKLVKEMREKAATELSTSFETESDSLYSSTSEVQVQNNEKPESEEVSEIAISKEIKVEEIEEDSKNKDSPNK